MTPEEFFKAMMPYARRVSERTGLDPRLVLAQSALETGYGKSAPNSNYFGIKGAGQVFPSEEFFDGKMVVEPSEFRAYENPQQSFDDYASFITGNKRYEPVLKAKTLSDQIAAMGASGYATDPNYGAKLSSIANMIGEDILPKGKDMATPMDRRREEELRQQMLATGMAPRTAPRAPLSALRQDRPQAAAAPQQRRSGLGGIMDYLGKQSPTTGLSRAEQFAAALDPLIMPQMRAGEAIRARGAQRMKRQSANKTVEYLRKNGYPEIAAMVEQNPAIASNVMSALLSKRLSPAETTGSMQNYEFLISQGLPKDQAIERAFGKGGSTFNLGPKTQISGDYVIVEDPTAEAGVRFIPIKGSKADKEAAAAVERQVVTQQQAAQKEAVISKSVDFLVEKIDAGGLFNLPEAGIVGNVLGTLGINQDAVDFKNELASIQANVAFDRLQQMREASKTGGALGAVSERELDLLMAAYGNIKQSTSPKKLKENLLYIEKIMTKIENDPVASSFYYNTSGGTAPLQTQATSGAQVGEPY